MNNLKKFKAKPFTNACNDKSLFQALRIISTAEVYDAELYNDISEIYLSEGDISLQLIGLSSPVYFGDNKEIMKTVYLSKIFKSINRNKFSAYLDYIDLRYDDLVYLGFDEKFINDKEKI
jgi:hypothetical protein